ncbi:VOC family protein [Thalassospira mesophila]|uniref:VOC family protein n=1 Tax=Thalassospira mesophila TaxID=1293891 RepID=UPI002678BB7F
MKITSLDHLVLTVKSIESSVEFYQTALCMARKDFGKGRVAFHFGAQKRNLHPSNAIPDDNVRHPLSGSADSCF